MDTIDGANSDDVATYYQTRYANTRAAHAKWASYRKRSNLAVIGFTTLVAISFGLWEFTCGPSIAAMDTVCVASIWSVLQLEYLLSNLPLMRSAHRALLIAMDAEPRANEVPNARPAYRFIAGVLAAALLLGMLMAFHGTIPTPTFIPVGMFYGFEFIWFCGFGYLAITGRWILSANRLIGRERPTSR